MIKIVACVTGQHDFRLVLLAAAVCFFSCYTALSLLTRAPGAQGANSRWLTAAAIVAGAGVWSTHFVAMLAYQPGIVLGYDIVLTATSIAIAMAAIYIAFTVGIAHGRALLGGVLFGLAVGAMHFTGMAALSASADMNWDPAYVVVSLLTGTGFGALSMFLFSRGDKVLAATATMTLAIAGLHFIAMTALTITPDPAVRTLSGAVFAPRWLPLVVASVMGAVTMIGLLLSSFDRQLAKRAIEEAARLRAHITELEETKRELEATSQSLSKALDAAAVASQSKSQFLATMSHELRTPLNAIIGFAELIEAEIYGPLGDARYGDYVKDVRDSGRHLLKLVNDILDFSKVDMGRLELNEEEMDIGEEIGSVMRMMAGQGTAEGLKLEARLAPDLPRLYADERRVRQILLNLISNAIKFTPSGGQVIVSAECAGNALMLRVADTGIGIAEDDIHRVLERFGRVDKTLARNYDGTGLGLPLAKRLIELHGGTLSLTSVLHAGTTVTIAFPASRSLPRTRAA